MASDKSDREDGWEDYAFRYFIETGISPTRTKRYFEEKARSDWLLTKIGKGDLMLDVGASRPIDAIRATWLGARFIALDLSGELLAQGRNFIKRELPQLYESIDFVVGDATSLPFKDSAFDTVISYSAIEHIDNLEKQKIWVEQMARVTKLGGNVVLTTSNKFNLHAFLFHPFKLIDFEKLRRPHLLSLPVMFVLFWLSRKFRLFKKFVPLRSDYYECFFTPNQLKNLLAQNKLKPISFESAGLCYYIYGPPFIAFSNFALKVDHLVSKLENVRFLKPFGVRMGFRCTKIG